jgi:cold shock protein
VEHLLDTDITFETVISPCSVVEKSAMTSDDSQAKPANCERQPDAFGPEARYREVDLISDAPIQSVVKWFNPKRGFGFVILSDGSGDAFLHRNVLAQAGIDAVEPRAVVKVRIAPKDQGLQVVEVLSVENSSTVPGTQSVQEMRSRGPCIEKPGTVKSFNAKTGYGFIVRDDDGTDVYFHASTLERAGLRSLSKGQRVIGDIAEWRQGSRARSIRVVPPGSPNT